MMQRFLRNVTVLAVTLLLGGAGCGSNESQSQVDPTWLERWEEAERQRPENVSASGRIAPVDEPGMPLVVHGQIMKPDERTPASDVFVFGYQTNTTGVYFHRDNPHSSWRLRGWAKTDSKGRFTFQTIRPGTYPSRREAAHIHFVVDSEVYGRQWDPTIYFSDDPLITETMRRESNARGPFGNVLDVETIDGVQHVNVGIQLKEEGDF